jgi:hypothetical protein
MRLRSFTVLAHDPERFSPRGQARELWAGFMLRLIARQKASAGASMWGRPSQRCAGPIGSRLGDKCTDLAA